MRKECAEGVCRGSVQRECVEGVCRGSVQRESEGVCEIGNLSLRNLLTSKEITLTAF